MDEDKKWIEKCDKLYPRLRNGRCCRICQAMWKEVPADHIHHCIRRNVLITRFYLPNLIPLCAYHHEMIHAGKMSEPIPEQLREHLQRLSNKNLKGYCIAKGITKAEFFQKQYNILKEQVLY